MLDNKILELEDEEQGDEAGEVTFNAPRIPLVAEVGSLLLVSSKPLTLARLTKVTGKSAEMVLGAISQIQDFYKEDVHGFTLVEVKGGFQFRTSPGAKEVVRRLYPARDRRLSKAAAETLAIVAYKQPVQRAEIESIRGVDAAPTLKTLLDSRLVRILGSEDAVGHPALYGTTDIFLEKFGLNDLSELPSLEEIERLADEPGEVPEDDFTEAHQ